MRRFSRRDFLRALGLTGGSALLSKLLAACNLPLKSAAPSPGQAPATGIPGQLPSGKADVIYTNGTVLTMDQNSSVAQAIALQGEKILAVGSNQDVDQERGAGTAVIDLEGRTLLPGFIDCHSHIIFSAP